MKKFLACMLSLSFALMLASCGGEGKADTPSDASVSASEDAASEAESTTEETTEEETTTEATTAFSMTAEEIDAEIQGTWVLAGSNYVTFDNGKINITGQGVAMNGDYVVDTDAQLIKGTFQASDGTSAMQIHYGFTSDNELILFNNANIALVKQ